MVRLVSERSFLTSGLGEKVKSIVQRVPLPSPLPPGAVKIVFALVTYKGEKKSRAPRKVTILCLDLLESLKWPPLVIFKG
jgi:hypothetical protein